MREWKVEARRFEKKRKPPEMAIAVARSTPTGFSMPEVAEKCAMAADDDDDIDPRLEPRLGVAPPNHL